MAKKPRASARESEDQLTYLLRDKKGELVFFAASILGNEANAEDAVITAYERAFQSLNTFTPGPATLETWFREIIQNACIDELRAGHLSLGAAVEDEEDPDYESVAPIAAIHPLSKLGRGIPRTPARASWTPPRRKRSGGWTIGWPRGWRSLIIPSLTTGRRV